MNESTPTLNPVGSAGPSATRLRATAAAAVALVAVGVLAIAATLSSGGTLAADPSAAPSAGTGGSSGPMGMPGMAGRGGHGMAFGAITISAINGSSISLKTADGWTRTITVDSGTVYEKAGATISLADLKVGDEIRFSETLETSGAYTIDEIDVVLPQVYGTVTGISGSTITLRLADGSTGTVHVTSSTTYQVNSTSSAALSDVKVGMVLRAEGTKASDGSITAATIHAGDLGQFGGRGFGHGFHGGDGDAPNGTTPNASASPSA